MNRRFLLVAALIAFGISAQVDAQTDVIFSDSPDRIAGLPDSNLPTSNWLNNASVPETSYSPYAWQEQAAAGGSGSAADGGGSSGAGAAAVNDPTQPLSQLQFQNVFNPESYFSHGYSNSFILQPIISFNLKSDFLPYHVVRPTLVFAAPTPDVDGQPSIRGGMSDLVVIDAYIHPFPKLKLNIGLGPIMIFPTATDDQLGEREWQLGPALFIASSAKENWILGTLVQIPFSLDSDKYLVQVQPIVTRLLKDEWYIAAGDLSWELQDEKGDYNIPLSISIGKVITAGKQPVNIFIQPQYTPAGFHTGADSIYGIKLSVSLVLAGAEFGYNKDKHHKFKHRHR